MTPLEQPQSLKGAIETAAGSSTRNDDRAMAGTIFTLGPANSRSEKRPKQLHARYKAAVVSDNGVAVSYDDFKSFYNKTSFDKEDFSGPTIEAMCHVVAMDKAGKFGCKLPVKDLMDVETYKSLFNVDEWTAALLTQAKRVYEDKHSTKVRFAIGCIGVAHKYL